MAGRVQICIIVAVMVLSAHVSAFVLPYKRCLLHKGMGLHRHYTVPVPYAVPPKPLSRPFTLNDLPQIPQIIIPVFDDGFGSIRGDFVGGPAIGAGAIMGGGMGVEGVGVGMGGVGLGGVGVGVGVGGIGVGGVQLGLDDRTQFSSRLPRKEISDSTVYINKASTASGNLPSQISDSTVVISGAGVNANTLANSGIDISDSNVRYENTGTGLGSVGGVGASVRYIAGAGLGAGQDLFY